MDKKDISGFELNKIAAAILLVCVVAMLTGFVANILYKPKLQISQRGYQVEVAESTDVASNQVKKEEVNIPELMAKANADSGAKIIKKCVSCHSFDENGANKVGPNLWKIAGGLKAKNKDFAYSRAFQSLEGKWDDESLYKYLNKPSRYIPGTKMSFVGLRKPEDIADVIAYLKERAS